MPELRSIFPGIPCLCLSATLNKQVLEDTMGFTEENVKVMAIPPNRDNIFLEIVRQKSYDYECDLLWVADRLREEKRQFPKTLIFVNTINMASDLFEFFMDHLEEVAFDGVPDVQSRIIFMYHGQIGERLQEYTLEQFRKKDSCLRLLICTVAFGMGVQINDIGIVIHWGRSKSVMSYWQEVGRCGRNGAPARAIFYPKTTAGDEKDLFMRLKNDGNVCVRALILSTFSVKGMDITSIDTLNNKKLCTSKCQECSCASCLCCTDC